MTACSIHPGTIAGQRLLERLRTDRALAAEFQPYLEAIVLTHGYSLSAYEEQRALVVKAASSVSNEDILRLAKIDSERFALVDAVAAELPRHDSDIETIRAILRKFA